MTHAVEHPDSKPRDPDKLIVRIPASVSSKADLLTILAEELSFPDYFGENWDALEEMLRDLSWLEPKRIVLTHESMLSQIGEDNLRIYRDILLNSANHWKALGQRELIVVFPDRGQPPSGLQEPTLTEVN